MKKYNHRDQCQTPDVGSLKEEFSTQISCVLPLKEPSPLKAFDAAITIHIER